MAEGVGRDSCGLWALLGNRLGDNRMIEALAAASGLDWRALPLRFNPLGGLPNVRPFGSLFTLTAAARATLRPPWPAVVLTSGKRAVPAALRIKAASGGRTRLVHLGRPQAPLSWFDLVITTPQYGLPARPNVLTCRLPATPPAPAVAIRPDLADLPRPRLVAIVGGNAAPQAFDASAARAFAGEALARASATGGSLLVATSPRTPRAAVEALRGACADASRPIRLSVFGEGRNAYRDFLAAADAFLVTDDSVSMVVDAAMTGRPVSLFRLPARPGPVLRGLKAFEAACARGASSRRLFEALVDRGVVTSNRDIGGWMRRLEADGLLDGGDSLARLAADELADAAARVRALADAR